METKIEELFEYLDSRTGLLGEEHKDSVCVGVRIGFYNDIIAQYVGSREGRGWGIFRGHNAEEKQKIFKILGEEILNDFRMKQDAATAAVIQCPRCGRQMRYIESEIRKNGKFLHRFDCKNPKCKDFERSIWMEILKEDCEKIFKRAKERGTCKICGELVGSKVFCQKEKGWICEKHCNECAFLDDLTSRAFCRYQEEKI